MKVAKPPGNCGDDEDPSHTEYWPGSMTCNHGATTWNEVRARLPHGAAMTARLRLTFMKSPSRRMAVWSAGIVTVTIVASCAATLASVKFASARSGVGTDELCMVRYACTTSTPSRFAVFASVAVTVKASHGLPTAGATATLL